MVVFPWLLQIIYNVSLGEFQIKKYLTGSPQTHRNGTWKGDRIKQGLKCQMVELALQRYL